MRSPVDLIELPYAFSQLRLLAESEFIKEAKVRDVAMTPQQLEGLHRLGLLRPMLRVSRPRRNILRAHREHPAYGRQLSQLVDTEGWLLRGPHQHGLVHDGFAERFLPRAQLKRELDGRSYQASYFLYSRHQLMHLSSIDDGLSHLVHDRAGDVTGIRVNRRWLDWARAKARLNEQHVIAVSALEARYLPLVTRRMQLGSHADFAAYDRWREQQRIGSPLWWLGVRPAWLRDTAESLLSRADNLDPLGDWFELVREADPGKWERLTGRARTAIEMRIAAEILLRYYEDLAAAGRVDPLPKDDPQPFTRTGLETRLKPKRGVEEILTRFGLSPHPDVLLVLEGATEMLLVPRVMRLLGLSVRDDFIRVEDAEGVATSLNTLVAYAIAPRGELERDGRYVVPTRPLTRLLSVTDAEGQRATATQRADLQNAWVDRMLRTLPAEQRTDAMADALRSLVHVDVWNRRGASFEFAHFTDRQLTSAIHALDARPRRPAPGDIEKRVRKLRTTRGNLDQLLHGISKPDLADQLWPVLERRIEGALERQTHERIPVVRVVIRAFELARETPRSSIVLPLHERD